ERLAGSLPRALRVHGAYTRFAIVLVLVFVGLPFVVRTVQPILEDLDPESEEASPFAGSDALADFSACHSSYALYGARHRLCPGLCPWRGRIRLGGLRLREHALQNGDCTHPDRRTPRGVRVR